MAASNVSKRLQQLGLLDKQGRSLLGGGAASGVLATSRQDTAQQTAPSPASSTSVSASLKKLGLLDNQGRSTIGTGDVTGPSAIKPTAGLREPDNGFGPMSLLKPIADTLSVIPASIMTTGYNAVAAATGNETLPWANAAGSFRDEYENPVSKALKNVGAPGWVSTPLGIVAEVGLDPLTYTGVGFAAKAGTKAASVADDAARAGRRVEEAVISGKNTIASPAEDVVFKNAEQPLSDIAEGVTKRNMRPEGTVFEVRFGLPFRKPSARVTTPVPVPGWAVNGRDAVGRGFDKMFRRAPAEKGIDKAREAGMFMTELTTKAMSRIAEQLGPEGDVAVGAVLAAKNDGPELYALTRDKFIAEGKWSDDHDQWVSFVDDVNRSGLANDPKLRKQMLGAASADEAHEKLLNLKAALDNGDLNDPVKAAAILKDLGRSPREIERFVTRIASTQGQQQSLRQTIPDLLGRTQARAQRGVVGRLSPDLRRYLRDDIAPDMTAGADAALPTARQQRDSARILANADRIIDETPLDENVIRQQVMDERRMPGARSTGDAAQQARARQIEAADRASLDAAQREMDAVMDAPRQTLSGARAAGAARIERLRQTLGVAEDAAARAPRAAEDAVRQGDQAVAQSRRAIRQELSTLRVVERGLRREATALEGTIRANDRVAKIAGRPVRGADAAMARMNQRMSDIAERLREVGQEREALTRALRDVDTMRTASRGWQEALSRFAPQDGVSAQRQMQQGVRASLQAERAALKSGAKATARATRAAQELDATESFMGHLRQMEAADPMWQVALARFAPEGAGALRGSTRRALSDVQGRVGAVAREGSRARGRYVKAADQARTARRALDTPALQRDEYRVFKDFTEVSEEVARRLAKNTAKVAAARARRDRELAALEETVARYIGSQLAEETARIARREAQLAAQLAGDQAALGERLGTLQESVWRALNYAPRTASEATKEAASAATKGAAEAGEIVQQLDRSYISTVAGSEAKKFQQRRTYEYSIESQTREGFVSRMREAGLSDEAANALADDYTIAVMERGGRGFADEAPLMEIKGTGLKVPYEPETRISQTMIDRAHADVMVQLEKVIDDFAEEFGLTPRQVADLKKTYVTPQGRAKKIMTAVATMKALFTTAYFPAHPIGNAHTNVFFVMSGDVDSGMKLAAHAYLPKGWYNKLGKGDVRLLNKTYTIPVPGGGTREILGRDIFILMNISGVGKGFVGEDVGTFLNLAAEHGSRNIAKRYMKWTGRTTVDMENNIRFGTWFQHWAAGDDILEAGYKTVRTYLDYGDLTNWEKRWARNAVFFYTWLRKSTPRMIQLMWERPVFWTTFFALQRNRPQEPNMPEYMKYSGAIPVPGLGWADWGAPQAQVYNMLRPGMDNVRQQVMGAIPPYIRTPAEILTKRDMVWGKSLEDYSGQYTPSPLATALSKIGLPLPEVATKSGGQRAPGLPWQLNHALGGMLGPQIGRYTALTDPDFEATQDQRRLAFLSRNVLRLNPQTPQPEKWAAARWKRLERENAEAWKRFNYEGR